MAFDLKIERDKIIKKMKTYNFALGKRTHFKIYDVRYPISKKDYKGTTYYFFDAIVISKDSELIPFGKHTIQLPSKRVVLPLSLMLEERKMLDNHEVCLTILKEPGNKFNITIHT